VELAQEHIQWLAFFIGSVDSQVSLLWQKFILGRNWLMIVSSDKI
jgi:hypothetical protein